MRQNPRLAHHRTAHTAIPCLNSDRGRSQSGSLPIEGRTAQR